MPADDAFAVFGLPRAFALDDAELGRRYRERSRACHPDLRPAAELDAALAESAALNAAYATLKDPLRRAERLLELAAAPAAGDARHADPEFLAETMDLREAHDAEPAAARAAAEGHRAAAAVRLAAAFEGAPDLAAARQALNRIKYCDGLLREFRSR